MKTDPSLHFVRTAERILAEGKLSSETAQRLRDRVERVKRGEETIGEFKSPQIIVLESL